MGKIFGVGWRVGGGEGGDAVDAGAVVGSCPQKSEGEAEGGGGAAAQREPICDRLSACLVATLRCRERKRTLEVRGAGHPCAGRATAHEKRMGNRDPADGRGEDLREEDRGIVYGPELVPSEYRCVLQFTQIGPNS